MGSFEVIIFEEVCRENSVLYLVPDSLRVQNYCLFSSDHQITFPQIDDIVQKLINNEIELDKTSAEKLFDELLNELKDSDYFAGHSLGENTALVCAGSLTLEKAAYLLHERGKSMQKAVPTGEGAMTAIIGMSIDEVEKEISSLFNRQIYTLGHIH